MTKKERLEAQAIKLAEMKAHEDELRACGHKYIAGIDEVGRGPLAGPVYAACVVLPADFDVLGVNDSKKLSAKKREELDLAIREKAITIGIGIADNDEIDELNILNATRNAMIRAIINANAGLPADESIDQLLIDAVKLDIDIPQESIIKGDEKCLSIASASIVAKVARDNFMTLMDERYPGYDFASNKGYGTSAHYEGLRKLGQTPIHRKSFLHKFKEEEARKAERTGDMAGAKGKAKKVYAVRNGREIGIFDTWESCKRSVDGFKGAEYKSFQDPEEALCYMGWSSVNELSEPGIKAYVDGSYNVADGRYAGSAVIINGDVIIELSQAYDDNQAELRNVAGEIMGARLAIDYCLRKGIDALTIYHDYEGVGKWGDDLWKANLDMTKAYKEYVAEARKKMTIKFVKVKAHSGNKYNELADNLAKKALNMI